MKKGEKMLEKQKKEISELIKQHWKENYELNMRGVEKTAEKLRGRKFGPHTPEWNAKISKSEKGKFVSEKTKRKQSIARQNFVKNNPDAERLRGIKTGNMLRGRKQSPEQCEKSRIGRIKGAQNKRWNNQVLNNFIDGESIKDFIDRPKNYDRNDWRDWDRSILLNDKFSGCGRHHVTEFIVICIPNEVHDFYKHCLATKRGMKAINKFAFKFLFGIL